MIEYQEIRAPTLEKVTQDNIDYILDEMACTLFKKGIHTVIYFKPATHNLQKKLNHLLYLI